MADNRNLSETGRRELAEEGVVEGIEITPEMIEAGVKELAICESGDSWWSTAEAVYRAMEATRRAAQARFELPSSSLSLHSYKMV